VSGQSPRRHTDRICILSVYEEEAFEGIVVWDVDSIDAAVRAADGTARHPAAVRIE